MDISPLATYFLKKYSQAMGKSITTISKEAMELLMNHPWPGNVRELENAIERAMVVGKPPSIEVGDLPIHVNGAEKQPAHGSLDQMEKEHIASILAENKWNISRSADILDIDRATLYNKIEKYGLKRPS
jgi:transcriptional regulator with PAS, ATPase and Fis domain